MPQEEGLKSFYVMIQSCNLNLIGDIKTQLCNNFALRLNCLLDCGFECMNEQGPGSQCYNNEHSNATDCNLVNFRCKNRFFTKIYA